MPYCASCTKLRGYGEQEPELEEDPTIEGQGDGIYLASGEVRVVLPCSECGEELKEARLDYEIELEHACSDAKVPQEGEEEPELELIGSSASFTQRTQTEKTDPKTGKVKRIPYRYAKTFYGAEVYVQAKCSACGEELEGSTSVEEQASYMESLS